MANSDWCDNAAKRKIRNEILPLIDSLPEKPELTEFERAIHRGFLCAGVKDVPITIIKETAKDALAQIQKPAWSEEDVEHIDSLLKRLDGLCRNKFERTRFAISEDRDWLRSLKDRVQPQPKQEWSEEDEQMIEDIIEAIPGEYAASDYHEMENWLKSLSHQNRWKPSEEMLEALYRSIPENTMEKSEDEMLLDKLYQGLKYGRVLSKN